MTGDITLGIVYHLGTSSVVIQCLEARDAAKYSCNAQDSPCHAQNYPVQSINSAEVEKLL